MTECSLFRQLPSFWRKLISRSENTTDCTEHSPWEANSYPVSQEIYGLSWNSKFLYYIHNNIPLNHIQNHKVTLHIFLTTCTWFAWILSCNLCSISHKISLSLVVSCNKFLYVFTYKTLLSDSLLSMPVSNITHVQHFPLLTFNATFHSRISRTLKSSLQ
jgi:hypothetical protein